MPIMLLEAVCDDDGWCEYNWLDNVEVDLAGLEPIINQGRRLLRVSQDWYSITRFNYAANWVKAAHLYQNEVLKVACPELVITSSDEIYWQAYVASTGVVLRTLPVNIQTEVMPYFDADDDHYFSEEYRLASDPDR